MTTVSMQSIEKYQRLLEKDPNHLVFAPLAEAYRELGMLPQAEKTVKDGISRHPNYVGGYVTYGRILIDLQNPHAAQAVLKKALELDPQNILAYHLLATTALELEDSKSALNYYKKVLFLNPQNEKARKAIQKLESLTADEFDEETFQMKKLTPTQAAALAEPKTSPESLESYLERQLSLVDAYLVRSDLGKAKELLTQLSKASPNHPELQTRWELLAEQEPQEEELPLSPDLAREKQILKRKIQALEGVLHRIKALSHGNLS
jgi:tetratricopeptide (TPR) repeat protein